MSEDDDPASTGTGTDDGPGGLDETGRGVTLDTDGEEALGAAYGGTETDRHPEATLTRSGQPGATLQNIDRAALREHYGPLRTYFKRREQYYESFQHQLVQAWERRTYDEYLAAVVGRSLRILAAGIALAVVAAVGLLGGARAGVVPEVVPVVGLPVGIVAAAVAGVAVVAGAAGGSAYWSWHRVFKLRRRVASRRRDIDYNLAFAVTFMYALALAGVNFDRIVARLADAKETYGAVGEEFDRVYRDIEMFGNNLYAGLENLRTVTPSEELGRFTDDLMTVLETGGGLAAFLRDEVDTQLETAIAEQETFIERLELLSEVFVVGFVAAPLFVLVVLIVLSFLGAEILPVITVLVYAGIPLALVGFLVLIDAVSEPFQAREVAFSSGRGEAAPPPESEEDPDWRPAYERSKQLRGLRDRLYEQFVRIGEEPWRALLFSVPIGLAVPALGVLTREVSFTYAALLASPVEITAELVVAPVVVALTPVALAHEYQRRRERALQQRFPDLLKLLATSNRRGLSLTRTLDILVDSTAGRLNRELTTLRNDIRWNADLPTAFEAMGDRLSSPRLTRTVKLIAEGSRATSDLHVVLDVAATDTAERVRLERDRRQRLQSYLVIVVIGFLVYLLVVLLLAANFLDPIEAYSAEAVAEDNPIAVGSVPVAQLRLILLHSALVQGFGSGVLAGKLAENSVYSGLKYGIALTVLAVVGFTVV